MEEAEDQPCWKLETVTASEEETRSWGERLAGLLRPGDLVLLCGELGTGKTRLAQGMARGLGVKEKVTSPTFAIMREYAGCIPFYHVDLYRLAEEELSSLGLEECLEGGSIVCVEWGEKIASLPVSVIPRDILLIELEWLDEEKRCLRARAYGRGWLERGQIGEEKRG